MLRRQASQRQKVKVSSKAFLYNYKKLSFFRSLPRTFAIPEKGFVRLSLFSTRITVWQIG